MRSVPRKDSSSMCFTETSNGQYRLRPLYYVSDADKGGIRIFTELNTQMPMKYMD